MFNNMKVMMKVMGIKMPMMTMVNLYLTDLDDGLMVQKVWSTICINILILIILITVINDHLHHHHIQGNDHHHQHHCYLTQGVARGVQLEGVSRSLHGPGIFFPHPPHILPSWSRTHSPYILLHPTFRPFGHFLAEVIVMVITSI